MFYQLRRRRLEKFSSFSSTSSNIQTTNDRQVSTQLSDDLASKIRSKNDEKNSLFRFCSACQINSQQSLTTDESTMDTGEKLQIDSIDSSKYASQPSTGDKRSYDINSSLTFKGIENNGTSEDGTIKKRKSEVKTKRFFSKGRPNLKLILVSFLILR